MECLEKYIKKYIGQDCPRIKSSIFWLQVWRGTTAHILVQLCGADTNHIFISTSNNTQQTSNVGKITDVNLYPANVENMVSSY